MIVTGCVSFCTSPEVYTQHLHEQSQIHCVLCAPFEAFEMLTWMFTTDSVFCLQPPWPTWYGSWHSTSSKSVSRYGGATSICTSTLFCRHALLTTFFSHPLPGASFFGAHRSMLKTNPKKADNLCTVGCYSLPFLRKVCFLQWLSPVRVHHLRCL